jgi:membrane protein implicated in regulation of membrane protease activity
VVYNSIIALLLTQERKIKRTLTDWLIVLASLADDVLVTLLVLLILWGLGVPITWPVYLLLFLFFIASTLIFYKLIIPVYRRPVTTGREGLIGSEGQVVESLKPRGLIKVKGEYWKAESLEDNIAAGEKVVVAGLKGLVVRVRRLDVNAVKRYDSSNTSKF